MSRCDDRFICSGAQRRRLTLAFAASFAVCAAARAAPASEAEAAASAAELKAHADAEMDAGAFANAISDYRASYEISHNPAILYNLGSAYERLGDYPRALAYLDQFARVAPQELKARVRDLPELIDAVRAHLARVEVRCNVAGARVVVRGAWRGTTPLPADIAIAPGLTRVELFADGYRPFATEIPLVAGATATVEATLVPVPPGGGAKDTVPMHASESGITSKWWFWTGLGVVAAGGVALAVGLSRDKGAPSGDIAPGRVSTPLVSW